MAVIRNIHTTHQGCLLIVLSNVCVLMETEHLWIGGDGEALHVVHVALVLAVHRGIVHPTWGEPAEKSGSGVTEMGGLATDWGRTARLAAHVECGREHQ